MRAVQIEEFGGPEVLRVAELPVPEPGAGELLIEVSRAGLNFGDTHQRRNQYIAKHGLPVVLGGEVAGTVVRSEVPDFVPGERVIALLRTGGYAEYTVAPAARTFRIPEGVSDDDALALLIQGLTAWHLLRTSGRMAEGESVVVHSAAGGVGSLTTQLAKPMGAGRVIATAGSPERRIEALGLGADVAVDPSDGVDLTAALIEANEGKPVDVILDAAGGRVFEQSLEALAPFGRIVAYGNSTREQVAVTNGQLLKSSRAVVGFWLMHLLDRREMLELPLADLFARAAREELWPRVGGTYPLAEASRAHEDLEARRTTGKLTLDPTA
ncbi:MAG TPA: zinc-binding dehydrogenase [Thermoleophilaceae bacterium]|nr:zinc-binding dehydrogenase [Thermoleophilaceae bacterium]